MNPKRKAMKTAKAFARLSKHHLGPWRHKGRVATAVCTQTLPIRNAKGKVTGHKECPLKVVVKREEGPPRLTEPNYHGVVVRRRTCKDKGGKVILDKEGNEVTEIVGLSTCEIGGTLKPPVRR